MKRPLAVRKGRGCRGLQRGDAVLVLVHGSPHLGLRDSSRGEGRDVGAVGLLHDAGQVLRDVRERSRRDAIAHFGSEGPIGTLGWSQSPAMTSTSPRTPVMASCWF